jgi:hypothetical protein
MDIPLIIKFSVITILVFATAWEYRQRPLKNLLAPLGIPSLTIFYFLMWIVLLVAYWFFFHGIPAFWELFFTLMEMAGATYLAREVNLAQSKEALGEDLQAFGKFDSTHDNLYYVQYYEYDGDLTKAEILSGLKKQLDDHTLQQTVRELKSDHQRAQLQFEEETSKLVRGMRRNRLYAGIILILLALWGHACLPMFFAEHR